MAVGTQKNTDVIRRLYQCFGTGDIDAILEMIHPQVEWNVMEGFPYGGTYRSADEVNDRVFKRIGADWQPFNADIDEVFEAEGNRVIGVGHYSGTNRKTGRSFRSAVCHVWTVENGKIRRLQHFVDTLKTAEAMT